MLMYLPNIFSIAENDERLDEEILCELNSMELTNDFNIPTDIIPAIIIGPEKELWSKLAIAEVNNVLNQGSWIL
jgi:hypothetical protein